MAVHSVIRRNKNLQCVLGKDFKVRGHNRPLPSMVAPKESKNGTLVGTIKVKKWKSTVLFYIKTATYFFKKNNVMALNR